MTRRSIARAEREEKVRECLATALCDGGIPENLEMMVDGDWLSLARDHGVLALLGDSWLDLLSEADRLSAEAQICEARLAQRRLVRVWQAMVLAFETAEIRAVTLKGPPLAERLYGVELLRFSTDIDILVLGEDLLRAEARLLEMGCSWQSNTLVHPSGVPVDLHGGGGAKYGKLLNTDLAVARSVRWRSAEGDLCWVLDPIDELLQLISHIAKHMGSRLGWLEDVRRHRLAFPDLDPRLALERAEEVGLSLFLSSGARMVCRELGGGEVLKVLAAGSSSPRLWLADLLIQPTAVERWPWKRYLGLHRVLHRALLRQSSGECFWSFTSFVGRRLAARWV